MNHASGLPEGWTATEDKKEGTITLRNGQTQFVFEGSSINVANAISMFWQGTRYQERIMTELREKSK